MNIKQAKDEIRHTVQAYLTKDALGDYAIPVVRQRPILLIGPPGIGKTAIMSQVARECGVHWFLIRLPIIRDRAPSVCHSSRKRISAAKSIQSQNTQ